MTSMLHPLIRYHGGKFRLASWIVGYFPNHTCYTESFGGAAGVLLQKPKSYAEVYNDLDGDIVNLFRVLQCEVSSERLINLLTLTPYARQEFNLAFDDAQNPVEQARRTIIRAEMGFGSAGAAKGKTGFRIDTRREYGTAQALWANYPARISVVCERLVNVLIENRPAAEILISHDAETTLHYVDPPYIHSTRSIDAAKGRFYQHELTNDQHQDLLQVLIGLKGMVVLSGYPNDLYNDLLTGWQCVATSSRISSFRGTKTRTECLWINPAAQVPDLFSEVQA